MSKFNLDAIIETLQGSCTEDLASAIAYHNPELTEDDLTEADHRYIDNQIFNCTECGWWCETSQASEVDGVCDDCEESGDLESLIWE